MSGDKKILVISFQSLTEKSGAGMARLGYYLSKQLNDVGLLKKFIVYSKGKFNTPFPSSPVSSLSRYFLFALNKLNTIAKFKPYKFRFAQELLFDYFCTFNITNDIDTLFVTQPYLYHTFRKAKRKGIRIVFVPANPEENYIYDLVTEENKIMGIESIDAYTYRPRIAYYNKSIKMVDVVIGTYPTVYTSYRDSNFSGQVIKINGHLKPDFKPFHITNDDSSDNEFRVGYLAHTVVLKGLQYLLQAWSDLTRELPDLKIKLEIAGKMSPQLKRYISLHFPNLKKVEYIGHIADVQEFMSKLDLFVVPSLVDGGPYTALEAAHCAVPVLITENSGSSELLSRNESGCWIIPIRDANAIKEKIVYAYNNRSETRTKGKNAKYNLDNYNVEQFVSEIADYLKNHRQQPN